jgi:hypothetical protein
LENVLIDGSATYKAGQFLRQATDGLLYESITGANSGVGDDEVHYLATADLDSAIGNDTTTKPVFRIHKDDVWLMNELDGTVARAAVGQWYDMDVTSNLCTVNVDSASHAIFEVVNPKWVIEDLLNDSADTLAEVYVQVLARTLDAAKTN